MAECRQCADADVRNARGSISTDDVAAQPRKMTDVGKRSRVAASVTHGRTTIHVCEPRGAAEGWHSAAPTGLDVFVPLHRGRRLRLTAPRLPTALTFRRSRGCVVDIHANTAFAGIVAATLWRLV